MADNTISTTAWTLGFKKGLHKDLPKTYDPGTIYVTTDEKAIYLDIETVNENQDPVSSRIRLSDIVQVQNIGELKQTAPPYNTNALYYIIDDNALLKYVRSIPNPDDPEAPPTHEWKQINTTETVSNNLNNLSNKVDELNKILNGNEKEEIIGLISRVGTNESNIKQLQEAFSESVGVATQEYIREKISEVQGDTTKTIEDVSVDVNTLSINIEDMKDTIGTLENVMSFIGVTTSDLNTNPTASSIVLKGQQKNYDPDRGDVVIYEDTSEEFVWDGSQWYLIGAAEASKSALVALKNQINHSETGLGNTYSLAKNAATQTALINASNAFNNAIAALEATLNERTTWGNFK